MGFLGIRQHHKKETFLLGHCVHVIPKDSGFGPSDALTSPGKCEISIQLASMACDVSRTLVQHMEIIAAPARMSNRLMTMVWSEEATATSSASPEYLTIPAIP
jgi:hypothetical protein